MTDKDRAHHLIDTLPESEVGTAVRVLAALAATADASDDPVRRALDAAPDDEEETESERAAVAEARGQVSVPHAEARRHLLGK